MSDKPETLKGITRLSALTPQHLFALAALVAITLGSALCAAGKYREAVAASFAVLVAGSIFFAAVSIEGILIFWFLTSPLASFYIRFPLDKSIITYNRAAISLAFVMLLLKSYSKAEIAPPAFERPEGWSRVISSFSVTRFEISWALLSIAALTSAVTMSNDTGYATKLAVDTFFLPLIAFHMARRHFDARGRKGTLLICAIALALFLLATGAYEFATGTNLFQYKGSELVREGERRVNGPFQSDSSYATISLLLAMFLQSIPGMLGARFDRITRLLYSCALAAAVLASLLPLFRATAIALIVCSIILRFAANPGAESRKVGKVGESLKESSGHASASERRPLLPVSAASNFLTLSPWLIAVMMSLVIAAMSLGYFSSPRRLTDPRNAFGRLATWETAAGFALENPLFGVGLANYQDYFRSKFNWEDESVERVMDTRAANSPHSNLFWVAAELGAIAFALYVAANVYLFLMGWRAMKSAATSAGRAAAACYLALFAAYWIHGLTLASGYYSDLNLYFFFMLGMLSNKSMVSSS